jgi:uncharacterized membrane protein (DUF485 family)
MTRRALLKGLNVTRKTDELSRSNFIDWVSTILALAAFFAYILVIGFAPDFFALPIVSGSLISIGLASGVALAVFLVALAGIYVHLRNTDSHQ